MPHSEVDIGPFGPCWGRKELIASVQVPPMTGTEVSCSLGILASVGNPASYVKDDGNGNKSSVLTS